MQTEPAFTETELAHRWNVSIKTLQRWRSEERGPPYIKLSKAVRYPVDEIVTYEQIYPLPSDGGRGLRAQGSGHLEIPYRTPFVRILSHGT